MGLYAAIRGSSNSILVSRKPSFGNTAIPAASSGPFRAGQQRLPNGNTLICEADCGRIFEVTIEGDVVWDYYSPFLGDQFVNIYRATRYSPEFVEPLLDEGVLAHSKTGRYGPWLR